MVGGSGAGLAGGFFADVLPDGLVGLELACRGGYWLGGWPTERGSGVGELAEGREGSGLAEGRTGCGLSEGRETGSGMGGLVGAAGWFR